MRYVTLLAVSVLTASCSTVVMDPFLTNSVVAPVGPPVASEVAPEYAIALLPSVAGPAHSIRQQVQDLYAKQEIVYENPTTMQGENILTVEVAQSGSTKFPMRAPNESKLKSEMRKAFPDIAMSISPFIGQNSNGVYGYATGSFGSSGSCIYAWQFIKGLAGNDTSYFSNLTASSYSAQVRLRYCSPTIGRDNIALFMQGLRVKPVSKETFGVLKFAIGSNVAAHSMPVVQPIVIPAKVVASEPVVAAEPAPVMEAEELAVNAPKIKNAAFIPLPDGHSPAEQQVETTIIKRKAAAIPLPDKVAAQ